MTIQKEFDANREAQFDVLPVLGKDRIYGFLNYTYVITGFALATWCFMIGGSLSLFVGFKTAILASISGNMIAVLLMITTTMIPSSKYGIDNYTVGGSFLGHNGTKALMILLAIIQACWIIVFSSMVGRAVIQIFINLTGVEVKGKVPLLILSLLAAFAVWGITLKGPKLMGKLNTIFAPVVVLIIIGSILIMGKKFGFDMIFNAQPLAPFESKWLNFLIAFELSLGAGFSWWPNMGGLGRLCKNSRAAYWPNILGLVFAATLGTAAGVAAALLIGTTDPSTWMIPIGGILLGIIALISLSMANLTACSIITYNICLGFKQIKFFYKKEWITVTGIFMIPVLIGMFFSTALYDKFYIILGLACTIYSPIIAIQFVDYFIFRKQDLDLRALYNKTEDSKYRFWKGFNLVAIFVFITAIPVYYLFLDPVTLEYTNAFQYITATGGATLYSLIVYYFLGKLILFKKKIGGYQ
ncbi:cytosine permease [Anaerovorax odorimutans]|uniref:cytosine permease n=1 Tax=Anaerovorax odorimutans TaxID=109327 RepID=UPI0004274E6F|nr:cytosine permease [Anaerovorax odorimutans]